jgi:predicted XRE-type DNA-binding protein
MTKLKTNNHPSVWDAISGTLQEAANLRLRSALIEKNDWTQVEAAEHCSVTQHRINELVRGRISRFSLDALVNIAASLGQRVHVELEAA